MATKDTQEGIVPARGRRPLSVGPEQLILAIKTIIEEGREEEFVKACKAADLSLKVPPATINFLKRFVTSRNADERTGSMSTSAALGTSVVARQLADCDECR